MKLLIAFLIPAISYAHLALGESAEQDTLQQQKYLRITPLPALFYTPETRLGFGGLVSGIFNLGDPQLTRNSNVEVLTAYTLNKQVIIQTKHNLFSHKERYSINGELNFYDFPILYYGIGNDTEKAWEENLEYKVLALRERVMRQVDQSFFIGPQYRFTYLYDLEYDPKYLVGDKDILEADTGINSGLGFACVYDTRDNILNAAEGEYFLFSTFFHGAAIRGDFNFNRYTLDLRKYFKLKENDILAVQYFGEFNMGDTPFREMALMGGQYIMRGYYDGRYRDEQQMAIQAEYRKQLISSLGVTAFAAYGDVAEKFSAFNIQEFKYAVGGGLRLMVNKKDRLNIRIDYGFGKETSGFYFAIAEAF